MKKTKYGVMLIGALLLSCSAFGQNDSRVPSSMPALRQLLYPSPVFQPDWLILAPVADAFPLSAQRPSPTEMRRLLQTTPWTAPRAYQFADLAFFCKVEVHLEKSVGFPVKFRLGDLNYVNYLEGKTP